MTTSKLPDMAGRERLERGRRDRMAVEMHRHDRADPAVGTECGGGRLEVDATGAVDIAPHRHGAGAQDRKRRRERREGRREDAVARLDAGAAQRDLERVEAAGDADRVRHAPPRGELRLEGANLLAQDEPSVGSDALDRR